MWKWVKDSAHALLAVFTGGLLVVGVVVAGASGWNTLDSKADKTATRLEAKIDAAITEMREERRAFQEEGRAFREELRQDRLIWTEQFNRIDDRVDGLDRRTTVIEAQ